MSSTTIFTPSKTQALGLGIGATLATLAMIYLANTTQLGCCGCVGWMTFLTAITYSTVWFSKYTRDKRIADQALAQRVLDAPEAYGVPVAKMTPGSSWIGLPSPLESD